MRRALLGSVVVHVLLLLALVTIWPSDPAPGTSAPSIIMVELVDLIGEADADGGRVPEATVTAVEPAPPQRDRTESDSLDEPAAQPPTPAEAAPERVADVEQEPVPAATAPATPEPSASEPPTVPPESASILEPSPESTILVQEAPSALLPVERALEAEPETTEIARAQRRMLDRKLWAWTAELAELTEDELSWKHRGREYTARFERSAADDSMGIEHVVVAVSTEQDGSRWSTKLQLKRLAFSSFAQFVDRWDSRVQIHDDEIDGRFHSNSEIFVASSGGVQPTFHGKVTTASDVNTWQSKRLVRHSEVFLGGLETRVRKIRLPRRFAAFPAAERIDPTRLQRFDADTRIIFAADGSYAWQALGATAPPERVTLSDEPHYLLAADDVSLYVSGIVNGKVLISTPADIVIEGDLVYAADPSTVPDSDDYLGLVAENSVVIADPETTGPGDLTVHAAVYAKRRFTVRRYGAEGPATLHVFGSVAAGAVSATEPRFRTKLEFDPRLEESRPPGFPMTDRYELVAWDGLWTVEPP